MGLSQIVIAHRPNTAIDTVGQCAINEEPGNMCGCVYPSDFFIFLFFLFCASAVGLFYRLLDRLIVALGQEPVAEVRRNVNPVDNHIEQDPNNQPPQADEGFAEVIAVLNESDSSQWQFLEPIAVGVRISGREIDNGINIRFDAVPVAAAVPVNELASAR